MSAQVHIPSLGGATEWLDSEPLGPAELRERERGDIEQRTLEITLLEPGAEADAFTFG
jgi:hypothetical protein